MALKTIIEFLEREQDNLEEVRMVLYPREDDTAYTVFAASLEQVLSEKARIGN